MNLMVILVPFLLITAVFSRLAILELNLPKAAAAGAKPAEPRLQLEVVVRPAALEVAGGGGGVLRRLARGEAGYDLAGLNRLLRQVKERAPEVDAATLLLAPAIDYDTVVQVMDAMREAVEGE
ncbi:MAG: biopolymer transporter ExbD, partial [Nitrospirae bacterium]